jgi:hypothetical protein
MAKAEILDHVARTRESTLLTTNTDLRAAGSYVPTSEPTGFGSLVMRRGPRIWGRFAGGHEHPTGTNGDLFYLEVRLNLGSAELLPPSDRKIGS